MTKKDYRLLSIFIQTSNYSFCSYPASNLPDSHLLLHVYRLVNFQTSERRIERKKRNEAVCVYGYRRPLYFFSLSLSLLSVIVERKEKNNRRKKQQEAIRADGQVIHLSRKLSLLSLCHNTIMI